MLATHLSEVGAAGPNYVSRDIRFAISATRLALLTTKTVSDERSGETDSASLKVGPLGGPLSRIFACDADGGSTQGEHFLLSEDTLAYERDPCKGLAPAIAVRNLITGEQRTFVQPTGTYVARIALGGKYLAVVLLPSDRGGEGSDLIVYDVEAAAEAYRVEFPKERQVGDIDVGVDGKVVAVTGPTKSTRLFDCWEGRVELATPSDRTPKVFGSRACNGGVGIDSKGILYLTGSTTDTALVLVSHAGDRRTLANWGRINARAFDAHDGRFALGLQRCAGGFAFLVGRTGEPTVHAGSPRCPVSVRAARRVAGAERRVDFRLRCPRGCNGAVRLKLNRQVLAARRVRIEAGARGRSTLRLRRSARRLLSRRGVLQAVIEARTFDRNDRMRSTRRRVVLYP